MKTLIYTFSLFLLFSSCKKEEKKHTVIYKIIVTSGHPTYSVSYSSLNNSTKSEGSIKTTTWTSSPVDDREEGSSVFLTLEGGSGGGYKMFIYIDGNLHAEDIMYDPYGPKTISADIRD
jgi:hypothetical protein